MSTERVEVIWLDAALRGEQRNASEIARSQVGSDSSSLGYLMRDDAEGVVIAQTRVDGGKEVTDCLEIPRAYVRDVRRLAVRRENKAKEVQV